MTFEEYWETDGSRKDAADHKERARLAWNAGYNEGFDLGYEAGYDVAPVNIQTVCERRAEGK